MRMMGTRTRNVDVGSFGLYINSYGSETLVKILMYLMGKDGRMGPVASRKCECGWGTGK